MKISDEIQISDNCFDVIRWICAITVFLGHFLVHFNVPSSSILHNVAFFIHGVPVFFFLSGLFIAKSLDASSTKRYLIKRTKRIFPELWLCVIINFVVIFFFYGKKIGVIDSIKYFLTQLTLFQFYTPGSFKGYGVGTPNGALWTIVALLLSFVSRKVTQHVLANAYLKRLI